MTDAVLSFALETIRDLLLEEARFLLGVRGEVDEMERELKRMKVFLEYADDKKDKDIIIRQRVEEIRELADEVEEVLQTFAIEVESRKSSSLQRYAGIFNKGIATHKVGSEIINIKTKLTNFTNSLQRYEIPKGAESSDSTREKERWDRLTFSHAEEEFVAMEEDIGKLVSHLVSEKHFPQVVSIWGMGGLGKTSLAREVYNHPEVRQCFKGFAWVCVTQQCQPRKLLQDILCELGSQNNTMTDQQLVKKLYEVQIEKKCLVVIDDIWTIDDWERLKHAFPSGEKNTGSKVLLTTRQKEVALRTDPSGRGLHEPKGLNEEDAWNLLQKKAFPRKDKGTGYIIDTKMEALAKEMLKQCKGLPLAVVVLGGILVMRDTVEKWEMVLQDINKYLAKGVLSVLDLSYKDLPYHLKPCFLFLANFSEDSDIKAKKLYHLWIAERIVSKKSKKKGQTMMDVAEEYLVELAQRCMVQVHVKEEIGTRRRRFKSCRLHDMMRELCLEKVNDENFLKVINGSGVGNEECSTSTSTSTSSSSSSSTSITKTRRLSIHSNGDVDEYKMYLDKQRASHVRSLLIFKGVEGFWLNKIKDSLSSFKLLSVLDFEGVDMSGLELPKAIGKLTQLRYLNLRKTYIEKLPTSIGELGYLETLDLRIGIWLFIPNVLWKLQRLRHLYLPGVILFNDREKEKKLRLDGLNNLETLVHFHSYYFDFKDLLLNFNNNLRELTATVVSTKHEDLHFSPNLNNLTLTGPVSKLPEQCHNLTKLCLWYTKLEDDPMPTLGKLPSLVILKIGRDVFMGKEMVCSSTDFLQLTSLRIWEGLPNLENWTVDQGAFPKLSYCRIVDCPKLKMIPDGFAFLTALKELDIRYMSKEFEARVKKGVDGKEGEDYHKVKHIPSIYIDH